MRYIREFSGYDRNYSSEDITDIESYFYDIIEKYDVDKCKDLFELYDSPRKLNLYCIWKPNEALSISVSMYINVVGESKKEVLVKDMSLVIDRIKSSYEIPHIDITEDGRWHNSNPQVGFRLKDCKGHGGKCETEDTIRMSYKLEIKR